MGGRAIDKEFKDTMYKMKVKYSLKDIDLCRTAYGVSEQVSAETQ